MNFIISFVYILYRHSRDDERIYLHEEDHVPVEDAIYLLHCLTGSFDFLIDIDENNA
jgi:hypothetical protein